jgi:hypothetical protein
MFIAPPMRAKLESLNFESGSKLTEIGDTAFFQCERLRSICLPASVSKIDAETFGGSNFSVIEVESGNTNFCIRGHLLLDFAEVSIVFYFGTEKEIQIPDEIETIARYSFSYRWSIRSVLFGAESKLSLIETAAFVDNCSLNVLHLPSLVREIGDRAFFGCVELHSVTFGPSSELQRIGVAAFGGCNQLESFHVPSSVEFIGDGCFARCKRIRELFFDSPSCLREFWSLPVGELDALDIPDSVEILGAVAYADKSHLRMLIFGEGSRLIGLRLVDRMEGFKNPWLVQAFVRIPAHRLKALRENGEFVG